VGNGARSIGHADGLFHFLDLVGAVDADRDVGPHHIAPPVTSSPGPGAERQPISVPLRVTLDDSPEQHGKSGAYCLGPLSAGPSGDETSGELARFTGASALNECQPEGRVQAPSEGTGTFAARLVKIEHPRWPAVAR
jgi:hypothetical protein